MFKQRNNEMIVNIREVFTRVHDALLFTSIRPNNEKYKRNIYYKGAVKYENFKLNQKKWLLSTINL